MSKSIKSCRIKFTRINGDQIVFIKIDKKLEELLSNTLKTNSIYYKDKNDQPLAFYQANSKLDKIVEVYNSKFASSGQARLDDYGKTLYQNGYWNFSILRTVGIGSGISFKLDDICLDTDMENWINNLSNFIKYLYRFHVAKTEIKATITLEF